MNCQLKQLLIYFIITSLAVLPIEKVISKNKTKLNKSQLIYSTFKDSRNLIWFGTQTGLSLYQGTKFIEYNYNSKDNNSILGGIIYSIAEDDKHAIWLASYTNGITIFNPLRNTFIRLLPQNYPELLKNKNITTIKYYGNETMLVNTSKGAFYVNTHTYSFKAALPQKYNIATVLICTQYKNDTYFLQDSCLIKQTHDGSINAYYFPNKTKNFMGLSVINNELYVSGFSGIFQFRNDSLVKIPLLFKQHDISNEGVNDLIEDKYHGIYVNSLKYGPIKVEQKKSMFSSLQNSPNAWFSIGNSLYSNYYDSLEDRFFVGTQQGLYILNAPQDFFNEIRDSSNELGTVRALMLNSNNELLAGTEGGLFNIKHSIFKLKEQNLIKKAFISSLTKLPNQNIIGGGNHFFLMKQNSTFLTSLLNTEISLDENSVLTNQLNDSIAFAISGNLKKIIYWDFKRDTFKRSYFSFENAIIPPALVFKKNILFNTYIGMYAFSPITNTIKKITQQFDAQITDIKIFNNHIIYSSSTNGIMIMDSAFHITKKIDLDKLIKSNDVEAIEIKDSVIWYSSTKGLGYYNLKNEQLAFYKSGDQFTTEGFMPTSSTQSNDTVYFGGNNGIVCINTKALLNQTVNPSCYLIDVSLYKKGELFKVPDPQNHCFDFDQNNIELRLVTTNTQYATFLHYNYQLNDNSSIPIDDNGLIKLYNLAPNSYTLNVFEIESGKQVTQWHFRISPPWFQTWWFRVTLALVVLANGIWITQLYYKRKLIAQQKELEKQQALQSERDRISIDMHDDLGSGLSSIKLISEMLKQKHNDTDTQNDLNEIVVNATELTNTMREMVWSLNPRNDTLSKFLPYLQQYTKRFFEPSELICFVQIPNELPEQSMNGYLRRNLFLCYKEVLNNIIKHSLASNVRIHCTFSDSTLLILIEDNGVGINNDSKANNGFYSMQKRMHDCNGTIEWKNLDQGFQTAISISL